MADPPATYAEISDRLGIPVGSIGPTRGRALEVLRRMLTRPDDDDDPGSGDAA
jgi:DNA-directed RNA polymerase specialized sigma24 family protein